MDGTGPILRYWARRTRLPVAMAQRKPTGCARVWLRDVLPPVGPAMGTAILSFLLLDNMIIVVQSF